MITIIESYRQKIKKLIKLVFVILYYYIDQVSTLFNYCIILFTTILLYFVVFCEPS